MVEGGRDDAALDVVFVVATLEADDTKSVPEATAGTDTALPKALSVVTMVPSPVSPPSNLSTIGRAIALSRLSESPNMAVDHDDAPESVIVPISSHRVAVISWRWVDDRQRRHQCFLLRLFEEQQCALRSSQLRIACSVCSCEPTAQVWHYWEGRQRKTQNLLAKYCTCGQMVAGAR